MAILAGAILRTSMNFQLGDGTLYQNVFQHRRVGPGLVLTDQQHLDAIEAWAEAMYAEIDDHVALDVVEQLSSVDRIEFNLADDFWEVTESIGVFTIAFVPVVADTVAMPNQVSPFITFKTDRPKSNGRKFLFPFTETGFTSALLSAPALAAVVAMADDAVNVITVDAPLDLLIPGIARVGINQFLDFTHAVVTDLAGTQRRRRRGYGA